MGERHAVKDMIAQRAPLAPSEARRGSASRFQKRENTSQPIEPITGSENSDCRVERYMYPLGIPVRTQLIRDLLQRTGRTSIDLEFLRQFRVSNDEEDFTKHVEYQMVRTGMCKSGGN